MTALLLDGRVAIVTGGGRGIGREHCLELGRHGAVVVVNDLGVALDGTADTGHSPADAVAAEIEGAGGEAWADHRSVSDWDAMAALVAETIGRYGRLDIVVNNAGILRDRTIASSERTDWDDVIAVHLTGTFNLTRHACAHWRAEAKAGRQPTGRIINTTSGTGLVGNFGQAAYGAAKAGIANLTMVTAIEMSRFGCTANAISPLAATRMLATMPTGEDADSPRFDPAAASPLVAWLASVSSGWLSGAVLRVTGPVVERMRPWEIDATHSYRSRDGERLQAADLDGGLRQAFGLLPAGLDALRVNRS